MADGRLRVVADSGGQLLGDLVILAHGGAGAGAGAGLAWPGLACFFFFFFFFFFSARWPVPREARIAAESNRRTRDSVLRDRPPQLVGVLGLTVGRETRRAYGARRCDFEKVTSILAHVGYYPGASPIHLKLLTAASWGAGGASEKVLLEADSMSSPRRCSFTARCTTSRKPTN